jgi:hypothetical protein
MDDSTNGMIVDLICDGDRIESITRAEMLTGFNLAMVGGEIISFQNIIPMGGTIYNLRNIFRARFDTEKLYHYAGERFWFLDKYGYSLLDNEEFVMGARRFFKFVSYTQHGAGRLDKARVVLKDIFGRSKTPLMPINLEANGHGAITRYQTDIVLTWNPRIRGEGAGVGIAYSPEGSQYEVTDASPTFEGCFKVKVTVGGSIVRTVTDIAALTCTYTQAMNISDNGGLASSILFEVSNYLTYKGNIFESPATSLAVTKMV